MTRHLSEQKGLFGLSFHLVGVPQIGHFTTNSSFPTYDLTIQRSGWEYRGSQGVI